MPDPHRRRTDEGFTLIELLVVIIIIGILAAIAIPLYLNQRKKAIDAGIRADLRSAAVLMETYIADRPDQPVGTNSATAFTDLRKSDPRTVMHVFINTTKGGYCFASYNPGMTAPAVDSYIWYDSAAGGLLNKNAETRPASSVACSATGSSAWTRIL